MIKLIILVFVLSAGNLFAARATTTRPKIWGGVGPHSYDYLLGVDSYSKTKAGVVFVDYDMERSEIQKYLKDGKTVICYVNVGAWENWRSDASSFPASVLGKDYEGWPGEKWLDIGQLDILLPIMRKRYQTAASKGCQGIDPDNMNGYQQQSGFNLSSQQQLNYNLAVSQEAKKLGLLAGLKNDHEQAEKLVDAVDFAVVEQCVAYKECYYFDTFISKNKPVFVIEYTDAWNEAKFKKNVCPLGKSTKMSYILKKYDLKNDFIVSCL